MINDSCNNNKLEIDQIQKSNNKENHGLNHQSSQKSSIINENKEGVKINLAPTSKESKPIVNHFKMFQMKTLEGQSRRYLQDLTVLLDKTERKTSSTKHKKSLSIEKKTLIPSINSNSNLNLRTHKKTSSVFQGLPKKSRNTSMKTMASSNGFINYPFVRKSRLNSQKSVVQTEHNLLPKRRMILNNQSTKCKSPAPVYNIDQPISTCSNEDKDKDEDIEFLDLNELQDNINTIMKSLYYLKEKKKNLHYTNNISTYNTKIIQCGYTRQPAKNYFFKVLHMPRIEQKVSQSPLLTTQSNSHSYFKTFKKPY